MSDPVAFEDQSFNTIEAAAILHIAESTLYVLLAAKKIKSTKVGRARRITGAMINEFRKDNADAA
ncbi:MAG TPA: helix-turn-helix domain-containing protein [Humisphaera sp.]|nr:helix-turn-helix domain-containing protein [Humisphaera sp.]